MSVNAALEAHAQFAKGSQPCVRAFDYPAVTPEPVIAFDAAARDAILDAATFEGLAAASVVVALVGMQLDGPGAWSAAPATHAGQTHRPALRGPPIHAGLHQ